MSIRGFFWPRLVAEPVGVNGRRSSDVNVDTKSTTQSRPSSDGGKAVGFGGIAAIPELGNQPLFQVFVLGTRGAGKTVFLSSLYKLLSTQDNFGNNFRLICRDLNSLNQLKETYKRIANPNSDWPPGSYAIQEYIFDCVHSTNGRDIDLFKFRYFDFPGGFVSDAKDAQEIKFILDQVRAAHSILILLDGKKIRNLIERQAPPAGEPSLYEDLDMLMDVVQNCIGKPMHFAITKSDILSPQKHSLAAIKKALLKHKGFSNIIAQQTGKQPVHLLPVSAVGYQFAKYDPVTQQMNKLPTGLVEPSYVDLSLTFTIVDYLTVLAAQLTKELPENSTDKTIQIWFLDKVRTTLPWAGLAAAPMVTVGGQMLHLAAMANPFMQVLISGASLLGARALINAGERRIQANIEAFRSEILSTHESIRDHHTAAQAVLKIQVMLAKRFQSKFPDSRL